MGRRQGSVRASVREARIAAYQEGILNAAESLFAQSGFSAVKTEDIARSAGVSKGTLYNYFESKEAIFGALSDRARARLLDGLDAAIAAASPADRPRAFVRSLLGHLDTNAKMVGVYVQATGLALTSDADPHAPQGREAMTQRLRTALEDAAAIGGLRNDLSVEQLTTFLGGLIGGAIEQWLIAGTPPGLTEQADAILDIFSNGARRR
jgi:TetR/AcrR family transcriptional repressor of nem operon